MPSPSMPAVGVHSSAIACGMISTKGMVLKNAWYGFCRVTSLSVGVDGGGMGEKEKGEVMILQSILIFA
jgi:hypothetical protein